MSRRFNSDRRERSVRRCAPLAVLILALSLAACSRDMHRRSLESPAVRNPFAAPYELPDVEAILILQGLLQNTYRAFDFRAESDIYDKLAVSVSGDLITDIYLQNRKRLQMEEQGGAHAKVQDVQLLEATQSGPPDKRQRLTFKCAWRITGTVNHWGHAHQRRNQYEALMTLQPIEQTWKLVALDLIDERRLP